MGARSAPSAPRPGRHGSLGSQHHRDPRRALAPEQCSLMQPPGPCLPKLNLIRLDSKPRPEWGARHAFSWEPRVHFRESSIKIRAATRERLALRRGPRCDLVVSGAGRPVGIRLRGGNGRSSTLDTNLPGEGRPIEAERGWDAALPAAAEILTLPALEVCVEDKTPVVHTPHEHHAHRGAAVARDGGERRRRGFGKADVPCGLEPLLEECDGITVGAHSTSNGTPAQMRSEYNRGAGAAGPICTSRVRPGLSAPGPSCGIVDAS